MTSRKCLVSLVLVLGLVLVGAGPAPASLCGIEDIVIFAFNSAHMSRDSSVNGDVVANSESPGPVLNDGAEVAVDKDATVNGQVKAHTLDLDKFATINGDVTYVELVNQGTINGTETVGAPPYTDVPDFQTASPGGDDVTALLGQTIVLGDEAFCSIATTVACSADTDCPGFATGETCERAPVTSYNNIVLAGGTVLFSGGGPFDVASISGDGAVEFDAPTDLRVAGNISTEAGSSIGPSAGSGIAASDVVIYAGGVNGGAGGPLDTPFAVDIGQSSTVYANIYAPNGTLEIDKNSTVTGSFLGLDVKVNRGVIVNLDSAFVNQAPSASSQDVQTDGSNPLVIILEGSDPEGGDLSFPDPVPVPPTEGTLSAITPIVPAPVQLCSLSGNSCSVDTDCPGFAEGETCDTVQPPITQASVTYTPNAANCVTEPTSGAVSCPEDFFTFAVEDECGDQATAVVSINGGTDEVPDDPGAGVDGVEANDLEIDVVVNEVRTITLSAAAPDTIVSLTFRVETLPAGALQDSDGASVVAGVDLPSPVLTYQAPATTGSDPFTFSARDSTTTTPPCGPPSCDTASVNIDVGNLPELAPDQSVGTDLNQPVLITLLANSGGTGSGGAAPVTSGALSLTYGENGPPLSREQVGRLAQRGAANRTFNRTDSSLGPVALSPTAIAPDSGWFQFGWCDVATSPTCSGALVDLVNETEVIESPFEFTTSEASCLRVTDTLAKGDHWRVEAQVGGAIDWTEFTSEVPQSTVGTTADPNVAFGDLSYSHGQFDLVSGGSYSVRLITIPPDSFSWGTAGFIRIDTGPCVDIVWTVESLPTGGTLTNLDGSPVSIGDTYLTQPTLVFTPNFGFTGATFFEYEVAQGGTVGPATIDTALVNILVSNNDPCVLVGRDPNCAPGGVPAGPLTGGASEQEALEREVAAGPNRGLTILIDGPGGAVTTTPVEMAGGRMLHGLACAHGECNKRFPAGATVTLFARPDGEHFEFVRWEGACWGTEQILTIELSESTVCTAVFREIE